MFPSQRGAVANQQLKSCRFLSWSRNLGGRVLFVPFLALISRDPGPFCQQRPGLGRGVALPEPVKGSGENRVGTAGKFGRLGKFHRWFVREGE